MTQRIELGITGDYHVHLRQGEMMNVVTPAVKEGGVSVAYIMPNLVPPVTTIDRVQQYKKELEELSPESTFLMTFYLCSDITPELVEEAAKSNSIRGIKCYPAGVTTNSAAGVDPNDFSAFYPIFEVMQKYDLVLNLHGEKPSDHSHDGDEENEIHVLNAEPKFLPALIKLHKDFPNLKIVLEHCTTKDAIETMYEINKDLKEGEVPKVCATITAHHLSLTIDDWAGNPVNYCKPVAKLPKDKRALINAATSGEPFFFFGSDSAPHEISAKARHVGVCAGVYTQPYAIPYVAEIFDTAGKLDKLKGFVSDFGNQFYGIDETNVKSQKKCVLVSKPTKVPSVITQGNITIVPYKPEQKLSWAVEWTD